MKCPGLENELYLLPHWETVWFCPQISRHPFFSNYIFVCVIVVVRRARSILLLLVESQKDLMSSFRILTYLWSQVSKLFRGVEQYLINLLGSLQFLNHLSSTSFWEVMPFFLPSYSGKCNRPCILQNVEITDLLGQKVGLSHVICPNTPPCSFF